jgi:pimeloyl-ACP methyl ester carboxylesterase
MLAYGGQGDGPPLVLLHGTNATRRMWDPVLEALAASRRILTVDLPAHGGSPPTSLTPPGFARDVAAWMDDLGIERAAMAGLSIGGWTALELAKLGRATGVLAMVPAGLWARRSPWVTDLGLVLNWGLGQLIGARTAGALRSSAVRRVALRSISAHPERAPAEAAVATAQDAVASRHFPAHFRATRVLRFQGGAVIPATVPVKVVWGERDRVARSRMSQHTDQLPAHAVVETWPDCGHMLVWDAPDRVVSAALALPTG